MTSTIEEASSEKGLARVAQSLARWTEKWFPDAFVFALVGLIIVFVSGMFAGVGTRNLIKYFGDGFWGLIPFTMQMAMIIIGGFVVATSPPVHKLIKKLAKVPSTPRGAVAFVVFFSMLTSLLSWGLGLIFGGILVREIVRNVRGIDYRAIGAASFVGNGSVWALGLSSSAALVMATDLNRDVIDQLFSHPGVLGTAAVFVGLMALTQADFILYDALIDETLLKLARPGAGLIFAGKRAGMRSCKQSVIAPQPSGRASS